mgnify:CR=1 FL=1
MAIKIKEETGGKALRTEKAYNAKMLKIDQDMAGVARGRAQIMPKGKRSRGKTFHRYGFSSRKVEKEDEKTGKKKKVWEHKETKSGSPKTGKTEYCLGDMVQESLYLTAGEVSGVGVGIQRHGVFLEFGVSNGHPVTGKKRAKNDWLSSTLRIFEPRVADVAAEYMADKYVREIKFL